MGQAHLWLKIGPIKVPRPPPGSDFHETDTRNPSLGVPGRLGAKFGNFELGVCGARAGLGSDRASKKGPITLPQALKHTGRKEINFPTASR